MNRSIYHDISERTDGNIYSCDIGSLNGEFYVYVAAFGIFTDVTYATPQNIKNTLGYSGHGLFSARVSGSFGIISNCMILFAP